MESLSSQQARAGIAAGPSRFSPNQPIPRPPQPRLSVKDIAAFLNQDRRELIVSVDKQVLLEYATKLGLNDLRKELEEEEADEQTVEDLCSLEEGEASHPGDSVDGIGGDHRADDDSHQETQVSSLSWRHKKFARSQKYFARKSMKAKSKINLPVKARSTHLKRPHPSSNNESTSTSDLLESITACLRILHIPHLTSSLYDSTHQRNLHLLGIRYVCPILLLSHRVEFAEGMIKAPPIAIKNPPALFESRSKSTTTDKMEVGPRNLAYEARDVFSRDRPVQQRTPRPPSYNNVQRSAVNTRPFGRDQTPEDLAVIRILAYTGSRVVETRKFKLRIQMLEDLLEMDEVEQLCTPVQASSSQSREEEEHPEEEVSENECATGEENREEEQNDEEGERWNDEGEKWDEESQGEDEESVSCSEEPKRPSRSRYIRLKSPTSMDRGDSYQRSIGGSSEAGSQDETLSKAAKRGIRYKAFWAATTRRNIELEARIQQTAHIGSSSTHNDQSGNALTVESDST